MMKCEKCNNELFKHKEKVRSLCHNLEEEINEKLRQPQTITIRLGYEGCLGLIEHLKAESEEVIKMVNNENRNRYSR